MFAKILLAADGSEHSLRAADRAFAIAKSNPEAKVDIIYVIDTNNAKTEVLHSWNSPGIQAERTEKLRPLKEKATAAGVAVEVIFLRGEPGPTIVKHANEEQFDLVVIGSRGLNSLQEFVLGSVSHKVAKRANCPVMIVK